MQTADYEFGQMFVVTFTRSVRPAGLHSSSRLPWIALSPAPRQRWCSIPFMIPPASQFKEKPPSQNGFFTLGHCCSSPWLIAQCPLSCGLSSFYSPFSLVRPVGVNKGGVIASQKLRQFQDLFFCSALFSVDLLTRLDRWVLTGPWLPAWNQPNEFSYNLRTIPSSLSFK